MVKRLLAHSCNLFYSHKNILLKDHLRDVSGLCARYVKNCVGDRKLIETASLIGKTHDFAKYTDFFQRHLCGEKVKGELSTHSRLSAISSAWIVNKRLSDPFLSSAAFLCVDCHHGSLKNFGELYKVAKFLNELLITHQINSIRKNLQSIKDELKELDLEDLLEFLNERDKCIKEIKDILGGIDCLLWDEESKWRNYFAILLLYSSLIDADRKDAGRVYEAISIGRGYKDLLASIVNSYRKERFREFNHPIDRLREEIFVLSEKNLEDILTRQHMPKIITITAPTGSGKTILGLYVALKIREATSVNGEKPRIIYSLPFINIIEQTYSVFNDILSSHFSNIAVDLLLKHHHLAFPEGKFQGENITLDKMLLLTDAWDSEIIVTTFEQLVRSIIGSRGSSLRKFHNLANSIIILDEVQAIPLEIWNLIQETLTKLTRFFNAKIIMMTATRPVIFRGDYEIIPDHEEIFKRLDRFTITSHVDIEMTPEEVVKFFFSKWNEKSSALIVLNTIKTSKIVYNGISSKLGKKAVRLGSINELGDIEDSSRAILAYLSTSIVPKERKRRVNLIRDLLREGRKVILVSTQVIEAGVDLDFDVAFRDIGPLDSIIQVSGRCNRNWRHKAGSQIHVIRVLDGEGRPEAEKIYGKILPNITIDVFRKKIIIKEQDILDVISNYYNKVLDLCNVRSEHLNHMKNLAYNNLSGFSLIKEEPKVSIFIEADDEAVRVLERFRETLNNFASIEIDDLFEYKAELRRLRVNLEDYIVNAWPSERVSSLNEIVSKTGIYYVPREVLSAYYDGETGFLQEDRDYGEDYIW
jgi:CRISPR-associated endonuclease/helicase Cas3